MRFDEGVRQLGPPRSRPSRASSCSWSQETEARIESSAASRYIVTLQQRRRADRMTTLMQATSKMHLSSESSTPAAAHARVRMEAVRLPRARGAACAARKRHGRVAPLATLAHASCHGPRARAHGRQREQPAAAAAAKSQSVNVCSRDMLVHCKISILYSAFPVPVYTSANVLQ